VCVCVCVCVCVSARVRISMGACFFLSVAHFFSLAHSPNSCAVMRVVTINKCHTDTGFIAIPREPLVSVDISTSSVFSQAFHTCKYARSHNDTHQPRPQPTRPSERGWHNSTNQTNASGDKKPQIQRRQSHEFELRPVFTCLCDMRRSRQLCTVLHTHVDNGTQSQRRVARHPHWNRDNRVDEHNADLSRQKKRRSGG